MVALSILSAYTPKAYKMNIAEGEESFLQSNQEDALQSFELALDAKETDEVNDWMTYTKQMSERKVALKEFDKETLEALHEETLDFPDEQEGKEAASAPLEGWNAQS